MTSKRYLYILLLFVNILMCQPVLKDNFDIVKLTHQPFLALEDLSAKVTIQHLLKDSSLLKPQQDVLPYNKKSHAAYWVKFSFIDSSSEHINWLIELYNYRIDYVELYIVSEGRIISENTAGDQYEFSHKSIRHKNFCFDVPMLKKKQLDFYFRFKSEGKTDFYTVVKRNEYFISYANDEYFYLGIFYGILALVIVCNLLAFGFTGDPTHIFYFGYAVCFTIYSAAQDGLGFQYLWPSYPQFNNDLPAFALCFFVINQLLFALSFHKVLTFKSIYLKITLLLCLLRIAYMIIGLYFLPNTLLHMAPDILYSILMLIMGIRFFKRGNKPSAFFIVGVVFFLTGYFITSLTELMLIPHNAFTIYAINIGAVLEMLAFFISVGDNSRKIILDKLRTDSFLKLHEARMQIMEETQNGLAQKIKEATEEITKKNNLIHMKNKELETFIYKSAHNLLGPVRNIKGLTYLSNTLIEPAELPSMVRMIHNANLQLENEILAMNKMSTILLYDLNIEEIDITHFMQKFFSQYQIVDTQGSIKLHSDKKLLIELFESLEATIKKVTQSDIRELHIKKTATEFTMSISFEPTDYHLKYLTEEFFLPLHRDLSYLFGIEMEPYILKCITEKLNGSARLIWEENQTGQFLLNIKDFDDQALVATTAAPL